MGDFRDYRPSMHSSRAAWEKSWADDLDKNYRTGPLARLPGLATVVPPGAATAFTSDATLMQMQQEVTLICKMQHDLAKAAARRFAEDDFEAKWKAQSDEKRREVIMEGIYRTMCLPDMEDRRQWCPDSTLKHLSSANGDAYLRMLKTLLPADLEAQLTEPKQIPHPVMDRLFKLSAADAKRPGFKTIMRMYSLSRTYCLTTIAWNIFLTFVRASCQCIVLSKLTIMSHVAWRT